MHLLALLSVAFAQPGIQPQTTGFGGPNRDPIISFGVSSYVSGPNPCPSILECRTCTANIGCVWSGTYCYQVKYQVTTCQGSGCATKPSECSTTTDNGPSTPPVLTSCNQCKGGRPCPNGMVCQLTGGSACTGMCQPLTTACAYGEAYDSVNQKCVAISCVAASACPAGYTCNTVPCYRYPCPVQCTPPAQCNSCVANSGCGSGQICQPSSSSSTGYAYSINSCLGTCIDSAFSGPTAACYALSTCSACTTTGVNSGIGCVWNGVQCYPSNFPCYSRDCAKSPDRCPAPCSATDCSSCAGQNGCVWTLRGCSSASSTPCADGTCATDASMCQAQQTCRTVGTCNACVGLSGCQWSLTSGCFFSTSQCMTSDCVTTCPDSQQSCNVADCLTCVSIANCQWSGVSRTCYYSTTPCTGPQCANTQSQCSAASTCSSISTCLACAAVTGCLWYDNTCYSIPCAGSGCAALGYTSQCPQPTCTNVGNCVDCVNTDGCMWSGSYCLPTATGTCGPTGCATFAQQCPESGCVYGEVWNPASRSCMATSCAAPTACPAGYLCQVRNDCGSALCPVQCTAPGPQCGPNEQWASCASSTCFESVCFEPNYATRVCAQDCRSGCQCMPGFARYQGACISNCPHYR